MFHGSTFIRQSKVFKYLERQQNTYEEATGF